VVFILGAVALGGLKTASAEPLNRRTLAFANNS
jgi:hypothetical protein